MVLAAMTKKFGVLEGLLGTVATEKPTLRWYMGCNN
jgi:hypothetical protein